MAKLTDCCNGDEFDRAIRELAPIEQQVIRLMLGLDDGHLLTREEVGKRLGLSATAVDFIERLAWAKLRGDNDLNPLPEMTTNGVQPFSFMLGQLINRSPEIPPVTH